MSRVRQLSRFLIAALFVVAGVMHFANPKPYVAIVPEFLARPELLVAISGVAEIMGGVGLLVPAVRRPAAFGLLALLVAVFPANINMALNPAQTGAGDLPAWLLWARLPLQPALMGWIYWSAIYAARESSSSD